MFTVQEVQFRSESKAEVASHIPFYFVVTSETGKAYCVCLTRQEAQSIADKINAAQSEL